jgi:predicted RNA-binding Zn-ribbon protein involved in translation (DUF1610 family)
MSQQKQGQKTEHGWTGNNLLQGIRGQESSSFFSSDGQIIKPAKRTVHYQCWKCGRWIYMTQAVVECKNPKCTGALNSL